RLARAEELPGPAELQVAPRDLEAVRGLADHLEPLARQARERRAVQQHAAARLRAPPDAPAQLMQLREPEPLGVVDHHEGRIRHVDPPLAARGGNEELDLPCLE